MWSVSPGTAGVMRESDVMAPSVVSPAKRYSTSWPQMPQGAPMFFCAPSSFATRKNVRVRTFAVDFMICVGSAKWTAGLPLSPAGSQARGAAEA